MNGTIVVNPVQVRAGDVIPLGKGKAHKVKSVGFCSSSPECVHIDGACYDTRFSTVTIKERE